MAANVEQTPDRRWRATAAPGLWTVSYRGTFIGDGDTPEEASDALAERIKSQT